MRAIGFRDLWLHSMIMHRMSLLKFKPLACMVCLVTLLGVMPNKCHAQETLSSLQPGTWNASPITITVNISDWGPDCGPEPFSQTIRGESQVQVTLLGDHVQVGSHASGRCWSANQNMERVSSTHASREWHTRCKTPTADPKQEMGVYGIVLQTERTLVVTERSEYNWRLNASSCKATVEKRQTFERATAPAQSGPTQSDLASLNHTSLCQFQAADHVVIRPKLLRMEPHGQLCFQILQVDAQGCSGGKVSSKVVFKQWPTGLQFKNNCFQTHNATPGKYPFTLLAVGKKTNAELIISNTNLADIVVGRTPGDAPMGQESLPDGLAGLRIEQQASSTSAIKTPSVWFWALPLAFVLIGFPMMLMAVVMLRKKPQSQFSHGSSLPHASIVSSRSLGDHICPVCQQGYSEGGICVKDGAILVPWAEFKRVQSLAPLVKNMRCPVCYTTYGSDFEYCVKDGAKLVSH